jgi:hypothetical protein
MNLNKYLNKLNKLDSLVLEVNGADEAAKKMSYFRKFEKYWLKKLKDLRNQKADLYASRLKRGKKGLTKAQELFFKNKEKIIKTKILDKYKILFSKGAKYGVAGAAISGALLYAANKRIEKKIEEELKKQES